MVWQQDRLTLSDWVFKGVGEMEWLPAQVPGCVHTDLLRNGRIEQPFDGVNERKQQWIDKTDWEYKTSFDVPAGMLSESNVELVFDGLDTYADVSMNGELILSADNMFRSWRVDVKRLLNASGNTLSIRFRSPIQEDLPKLDKLGYSLPATNDQSENGELGDKKVSIFARKAPYHYGWDWGPRFVTSGIWREVRLESWTGARVNDLFIRQDEVSAASARLTAVVEVVTDEAASSTIKLSSGDQSWESSFDLVKGSNTVEVPVVIDQPRLWWSRGLGEPHLYAFTVAVEAGGAKSAKTVKTGLRTVRLVTERDEVGNGSTFHFELNGIKVFAKGANHIPNDSFVTDMTYERYRHEIASAAESNMNMLRVWGGGIYEDRRFYELCDEYGMMVWQDFMFACSMYPGDEVFVASVKAEAAENVRRLRNHPSIVLWCGNNEIDTAWSNYGGSGWGWKNWYTPEQREEIWRAYEEIFHRILPEAVAEHAPGMPYWASSPMEELTGDASQHATYQSTRGDMHYWGVWHAKEPFSHYNVVLGRFMSEYGFQSFPEPRTVRTYAAEADMALESEVMLSHQRSGAGNQLIKAYMDMYLKEPKDFSSFLHMSQVLQAEGIKHAIEAHRRRKPYCMGTLYWQMNDCWPVASWSSMDYYGRWKALQYIARKSFRDISLSVDCTGKMLDFHVISDVVSVFEGSLRVRLFDFSGKLKKELAVPARGEANTAVVVYSLDPEELLEGVSRESVVLYAELLMNDDTVVDSKEHYFVPSKDLELGVPVISMREEKFSSERDGNDRSRFVLETDVLAQRVCLTTEREGIFTDNYFDLIPGIPVTVEFFARSGDDNAAAFVPASPGNVTVTSMSDWIKRG